MAFSVDSDGDIHGDLQGGEKSGGERRYQKLGLEEKGFSSSRLVTPLILDGSFPSLHEFQPGEVAQGLIGAHAVAGMFPPQELAVQRRQLVGSGHHLAELFVVGAVRALHVAVQFRRSRGAIRTVAPLVADKLPRTPQRTPSYRPPVRLAV